MERNKGKIIDIVEAANRVRKMMEKEMKNNFRDELLNFQSGVIGKYISEHRFFNLPIYDFEYSGFVIIPGGDIPNIEIDRFFTKIITSTNFKRFEIVNIPSDKYGNDYQFIRLEFVNERIIPINIDISTISINTWYHYTGNDLHPVEDILHVNFNEFSNYFYGEELIEIF